jgi:hypothetical protein
MARIGPPSRSDGRDVVHRAHRAHGSEPAIHEAAHQPAPRRPADT